MQVRGKTKSLGWLKYLSLLHSDTVHHTVNELVGRCHDGVTAVTLQLFVSAPEFEDLLAHKYTFKSPATVELLAEHSPQLSQTLRTWLDVSGRVTSRHHSCDQPPLLLTADR